MMRTICSIAISAILLLPALLSGQGPPRVPTGSLVRAATGSSNGAWDPTTQVMIANRARVLGNRATASGTQYFAVTDRDIANTKPEDLIQRLSPVVTSGGEPVRKVEILVDLQRPLTVVTHSRQSVNLGTAILETPSLRNIEVDTGIFGADLTVIAK